MRLSFIYELECGTKVGGYLLLVVHIFYPAMPSNDRPFTSSPTCMASSEFVGGWGIGSLSVLVNLFSNSFILLNYHRVSIVGGMIIVERVIYLGL